MDKLTFTIEHPLLERGALSPEEARMALLSLPWGEHADAKVVPSREIVGDDFGDFSQACALGALGFFAIDLPAHREKRVCQRMVSDLLDEAYELCGLDRVREYKRIAAEMEAHLTSGIWARSTSEYAYRCAQLDDAILDRNHGLRQTLREVQARLPWVVDTAQAVA